MLKNLALRSLFLIVVCAPAAIAQDFDYGTIDDLKDVKKVFVFTGTDLSARENIIKEVGKKLPQLTFTANADDAEVVLEYGSSAEKYFAGMSSSSDGFGGVSSNARYGKKQVGAGVVMKKGENGRLRLVLNFNDEQKSRFERRPSTNFARKFIDAYRKANNLKN